MCVPRTPVKPPRVRAQLRITIPDTVEAHPACRRKDASAYYGSWPVRATSYIKIRAKHHEIISEHAIKPYYNSRSPSPNKSGGRFCRKPGTDQARYSNDIIIFLKVDTIIQNEELAKESPILHTWRTNSHTRCDPDYSECIRKTCGA